MARRRPEPEIAPVSPTPEAPPVEAAPEPEPEVAVLPPEPVAEEAAEVPEVVPEPPAPTPTAKWEGLALTNIKSGTVLGRLSPLAAAFIGGGMVTPIWYAGQAELMGPAMSTDKAREWLAEKATRAGWVVA